jgi:hypothetical protein
MPVAILRAPRQCGAARSSFGRRCGRAHRGDFVDLAAAIIGDPLANLGSMVEGARAHPRAIEPKPFPIPIRLPVDHITLGMNRAVFVVFDVSLSHILKDSTPPTHSLAVRCLGRCNPPAARGVGFLPPFPPPALMGRESRWPKRQAPRRASVACHILEDILGMRAGGGLDAF